MELSFVSEFGKGGNFSLRNENRRIQKVWLNSSFRVPLIKKGIEKAGSINKLGRVLGYRSRVHPGWSIRQILIGKQAFPFERLKKLSEFLDYPIDDIMKHLSEERRITPESTSRALQECGLHYYLPR
jgi:hypothetical protein